MFDLLLLMSFDQDDKYKQNKQEIKLKKGSNEATFSAAAALFIIVLQGMFREVREL